MNEFFNFVATATTSLFFVLVDLLKHWSFVVLLITFIFKKQLKEFFSNINVFKLGKNGIELEKTVLEAKETLSDLKELAFTTYVPLIEILSQIGRNYSSISIEERFKYRQAMEKFIQKNKVNDNTMNKKLEGLNNSILNDILFSMIDNLIGTESYREIHKLFGSENKGCEYFQCNPDIQMIEKKLIEYELMDDSVKYIFDEVKYFIENKDIMNLNLLNQHMQKKARKKTIKC